MRFFIVFSILMAPLLSATLVPMPREIVLGEGKLVVDVQTGGDCPRLFISASRGSNRRSAKNHRLCASLSNNQTSGPAPLQTRDQA
jgi:hypothetical protein